ARPRPAREHVARGAEEQRRVRVLRERGALRELRGAAAQADAMEALGQSGLLGEILRRERDGERRARADGADAAARLGRGRSAQGRYVPREPFPGRRVSSTSASKSSRASARARSWSALAAVITVRQISSALGRAIPARAKPGWSDMKSATRSFEAAVTSANSPVKRMVRSRFR